MLLSLTFLAYLSLMSPKQQAELPSPPVLQACPTLAKDDPALHTLSNLAASDRPVQVNVEFTDIFVDEKVNAWTRAEQDNVCTAAANMQQVWSSIQFKTAVNGKSWILKKERRHLRTHAVFISGPDLYAALVGNGLITLRVSVSDDREIVQNYATTDSRNWTVIQKNYLDQTAPFECLKTESLLSCLTHTLSHEYTHYGASVTSEDDSTGAVDNDDWVSYGIGDLTESLAFPHQ